ncbi:MAG: hypothetical protein H0U00_05265 [Actinobacteria bacterium]|nr:hypothetical protein [Actinomycetota bacterium]
MKRKRKKIVLLTPEEKAAQEERLQALLRIYERAKVELETGKRPPPDPSHAGI